MDELALLYLASMKGSANRSITLCKLTMKLSVATVSGSTCIAPRLTLSEIAVAKYRRTASRDAGEALTSVLKIWNKDDCQMIINKYGLLKRNVILTWRLFKVPLRLAFDESTSGLVRLSGSEKYVCAIDG